MVKKNLLISLIFPVIMIVNGIMSYHYWSNSYNEIAMLSPYPIIVFGILSVLITIITKTDTSKYFKMRTVFLLISLALFELPIYLFTHASEMTKVLIFYALLWCMFLSPMVLLITETVVVIKRKPTKMEFVIFLLSNKILADLIAVTFVLADLSIHGI